MQAYQCRHCGYESLTTKYYCPKCRHTEFSKVNINETGDIYSYTTIHIAPPKFAEHAPYHVVLVQMTDRLRVTGYMNQDVNIGDRVRFKEFSEGAYVFEKV
ncbi:Zn-ribbon domain-containing OB-fold protein [Tenuibacillus multivorans]|uniref:ChsH2 C-terminal OB-fold domain-containing protein n=1 Tax=Tenuibacillus multivorans TaxID=237069 RepID=A0A1H0BZX2_9BACI|nr:OB-fold domain-containing protein [Tenuibacillus multivorans]GEL78585.1 hypothetical protein TMU01_28200 [Tenuibacillus multivorans]SDN51112.1 hypothetical protein SAMN05216498_2451 [Tenuibacillus multivorans]